MSFGKIGKANVPVNVPVNVHVNVPVKMNEREAEEDAEGVGAVVENTATRRARIGSRRTSRLSTGGRLVSPQWRESNSRPTM